MSLELIKSQIELFFTRFGGLKPEVVLSDDKLLLDRIVIRKSIIEISPKNLTHPWAMDLVEGYVVEDVGAKPSKYYNPILDQTEKPEIAGEIAVAEWVRRYYRTTTQLN